MNSRTLSIGAGAFAGALTFGVAGMFGGELYENLRGYNEVIDTQESLDQFTDSFIQEKTTENGTDCKVLTSTSGGIKDVISRYALIQCNDETSSYSYSLFESETDPARTPNRMPIGSVIIGSVVGSLAVIKFTEDR